MKNPKIIVKASPEFLTRTKLSIAEIEREIKIETIEDSTMKISNTLLKLNCSFKGAGNINTINISLTGKNKHIVAHYSDTKHYDTYCCVDCGDGSSACGDSACLSCDDGSTACCS